MQILSAKTTVKCERNLFYGSEVAKMFKCICWNSGSLPKIKSCMQLVQHTVTCGSQDNYKWVTDQRWWMCWLMYLNGGVISKNYIELNICVWLVCTTAQMQSAVFTQIFLVDDGTKSMSVRLKQHKLKPQVSVFKTTLSCWSLLGMSTEFLSSHQFITLVNIKKI